MKRKGDLCGIDQDILTVILANMSEPAAYSNTDQAEELAVNLLRSKLDSTFVKEDIRTRDKLPNVDGTIEIVDAERRPTGKLDVQVKKISDGKTSYSCPTSLVAYSKKTTLPVILICSDTSISKVYWRHIHSKMEEYRPDQDTFTVHFKTSSDLIDDDQEYLQKWKRLTLEYQERVEQYPRLNQDYVNRIIAPEIPAHDVALFQTYLDTINSLLDKDFPGVKNIFYPGVWKLGVGVYGGDGYLSYDIYGIPYGQASPLIVSADSTTLTAHKPLLPPNVKEVHSTSRGSFTDPKVMGERYVFDLVCKALHAKLFTLQGEVTSTDVLFAFIDRYNDNIIKVEKNQDVYNLGQISVQINDGILYTCRTIVERNQQSKENYHDLDLDAAKMYIAENSVEPTFRFVPYSIELGSYMSFSMQDVFDALRCLRAMGIKQIERPLAKAMNYPPPPNNYVWAGYTREQEIGNIQKILESALYEYPEFMSANEFNMPSSYYLNNDIAIVILYQPTSKANLQVPPSFMTIYLENASKRLPKFSFRVTENEMDNVSQLMEQNEYVFEGETYSLRNSSWSSAAYLFSTKTPVLEALYKMLKDDLHQNYSIDC